MTEAEQREALRVSVLEAASQCRNKKCLADATATAKADLAKQRDSGEKAEGTLKDILGPLLDGTLHIVRLAETVAVEIEYYRESERLIVRHIEVVPFGKDPAILSENTIRSAVYNYLDSVDLVKNAMSLLVCSETAQEAAHKEMNQFVQKIPIGIYDLSRGQYLRVHKPSLLHVKTCAIEEFWKAND